MYSNTPGVGKKPSFSKKNTVETLSELSSSIVKKGATDIGKIGTGIADDLLSNFLGGYESKTEQSHSYPVSSEQKTPERKKGNVFLFSEHRESQIVPQEVQALTEEIKKEAKVLAKEITETVKDAEKLVMQPLSADKPGIYHMRLMEVILSMLRNLRVKVGESRTWMQALMTKKAKRGSAFAARSKSKGTQYSLSQELSNARSIQ